MRIVHLPTDLGQRAYSLCRAERELGMNSRMFVKSKGVHESGGAKPLNNNNYLEVSLNLLLAFCKSIQSDVVMANCGQSLLDSRKFRLNLIDVPIYGLFAKRLIVTFQGCDIRLCETCPVRATLPANIHCSNARQYSYKDFDLYKLKRFNVWSKYADALFGITPDLCQVSGIIYSPHAKYLDSYSVKNYNTLYDRKVRIGHMARRNIGGKRIKAVEYLKGTPWIEDQIRNVIQRYPKHIEYLPIENMPWQECLNIVASCDIIVDQVVSGWYGGISVEAALMGTLPIAYINSKLLRHIPREMQFRLPVLSLVDKEELDEILTSLINHRENIIAEALRCRENALMFHDARVVAKNLIIDYYQ